MTEQGWTPRVLLAHFERSRRDPAYARAIRAERVSWTENHQITFYALEYLAGSLVPHEAFTNDAQVGSWHAARGRANLLR